jgi:hypothetical protein
MVAEPGVRFGIANGLIVAVLFVAAVVHLTDAQTEFLTGLVAGLACCGLSRLLTAGVGVAAWAMFTGFVVNRYGVLTLGLHDLVRLAAFALATVAVATAGRGFDAAAWENGHG